MRPRFLELLARALGGFIVASLAVACGDTSSKGSSSADGCPEGQVACSGECVSSDSCVGGGAGAPGDGRAGAGNRGPEGDGGGDTDATGGSHTGGGEQTGGSHAAAGSPDTGGQGSPQGGRADAGEPSTGGVTTAEAGTSSSGGRATGGATNTGGASEPPRAPSSCAKAFEEASTCSERAGTTYYVSSSSGRDSNDGLSEQNALKTLAPVGELDLGPGDRVLFKCGDRWELEQLNVTRSGEECQHIVYSSYPASCPDGQAPTLSGRRQIQGWTEDSDNLWVADLGQGENAGRFPRGINQLFQRENRLPMGKWPNPDELANGFSYIDQHDGNVIEDEELPAGDWTGAVVRIRTVRWLLVNREVVRSSGAALTLNDSVDCYADTCGNPDPNDSSRHGFGYQITNHVGTLDQEGEWYYDADANQVYLVSAAAPEEIWGSAIPDWADAEEQRRDYDGAVRIGTDLAAHVHDVVIENLRIEGYFGSGIAYPVNLEADENYNLIIRCNRIENVEGRGLSLATWVWNHPTLSEWYGGRSLLVQGNVIQGPNHYGIHGYTRQSEFVDNVITDVGRANNLGRLGLGCEMEGDNCTENGDGIHLPVSQASINGYELAFRNNHVARTAYCGFDIFGHDVTLEQNLIEQACITKADCGSVRTFGREGDSPAHDITLDHNILLEPVGNVDGGGMGFDTPMAFGLYIDHYSASVLSTGNTIMRAASAGILYQDSDGSIENNTLFDTALDGGSQIQAPGVAAANNIELSTAEEPNGQIFYNASSAARDMALTASYEDLDGNPVTGTLSLGPYESVILVRQ
jgi:hypothetical protein